MVADATPTTSARSATAPPPRARSTGGRAPACPGSTAGRRRGGRLRAPVWDSRAAACVATRRDRIDDPSPLASALGPPWVDLAPSQIRTATGGCCPPSSPRRPIRSRTRRRGTGRPSATSAGSQTTGSVCRCPGSPARLDRPREPSRSPDRRGWPGSARRFSGRPTATRSTPVFRFVVGGGSTPVILAATRLHVLTVLASFVCPTVATDRRARELRDEPFEKLRRRHAAVEARVDAEAGDEPAEPNRRLGPALPAPDRHPAPARGIGPPADPVHDRRAPSSEPRPRPQ